MELIIKRKYSYLKFNQIYDSQKSIVTEIALVLFLFFHQIISPDSELKKLKWCENRITKIIVSNKNLKEKKKKHTKKNET